METSRGPSSRGALAPKRSSIRGTRRIAAAGLLRLQLAMTTLANCASTRGRAGELGDLGPFLDVLAQKGVQLGRRHHHRGGALAVPRRDELGAGDGPVDRGV